MDDRQDVTVPMPAAMKDEIVDDLEYGDSIAGWIRVAIVERLEREGVDVTDIRAQLGDEGNLNSAAGFAD